MIDWIPLIQQCAPEVAVSTMQAVIRTESGFNPNALNINGKAKLARQPKSKTEAASWAQWLISRGYSVDMGLMQINSVNLARLGLNASTVFDPCRNLQAGASILVENYKRARSKTNSSHAALLKAISAYNTGNFERGFRNGYVAKVVQAPTALPNSYTSTPPLIMTKESRQKAKGAKRTSDTRTAWQVEKSMAANKVAPKPTGQVLVNWNASQKPSHFASTTIEDF